MIRRALKIGRWQVEFYFAKDSYDPEMLLERLYEFGASSKILKKALRLMEKGGDNTGFTFANPNEYLAIVAIGPTTSGAEFQDSFVHEIHHLAVAIAKELNIDLDAESPAYIAGDSARALAEVICEMGCEQCHSE